MPAATSQVGLRYKPTWDVATGMAWDNAAAYVNIYVPGRSAAYENQA